VNQYLFISINDGSQRINNANAVLLWLSRTGKNPQKKVSKKYSPTSGTSGEAVLSLACGLGKLPPPPQ